MGISAREGVGKAGQGRGGGTGFHIENDFIFNEKASRDSTRNAGNAGNCGNSGSASTIKI